MSIIQNYLVSIITPNFNRADLLRETANSILNQQSPYWEWIVVDDGSSDESLDLLFQYANKDSRIRIYLREGEKRGACICRNQGVAHSSGDYLIFLDSDDLLEPFCIENRVKALQAHPELDFGIFPSLLFREKPHDLKIWWNVDKPESELSRQFRQDAICQGTGILIKKEAFLRLGQWDETLFLWQDIDLFLRAYIQGYKYAKFFDLPPDLHIRRLETSLSRGDFFAYEKQLSRIVVVKRAVALLQQYGKASMVPEAKYMVAEIYSGLVRSRYFTDARNLLNWGVQEKVFTRPECESLRRLLLIYKYRLYRVLPENYAQNLLLRHFSCETSLGKITYDYKNPIQ